MSKAGETSPIRQLEVTHGWDCWDVREELRPLVLFLCTGNYYRSRFAERLFIARACLQGLDWNADSRGLFETPNPNNVGFMSPFAVEGLTVRGVDLGPHSRFPMPVVEDDFRRATRIVALDESEHEPLIKRRFPRFLDCVDFWRVHDIDRTQPVEALAAIEIQVQRLVDALVAVNMGEVARVAHLV